MPANIHLQHAAEQHHRSREGTKRIHAHTCPTCLPIWGDTTAYTPPACAAALTTEASPPVVPITKDTPLSA